MLYHELSRRFGSKLVFLDSESIPPGKDFASALLGRVRQAWVVLAVIGPDWLTAVDGGGHRRVDDPADWTRRELAEAFAADVTVIPVLTDDANIPLEGQLPADIGALSRCQYRRLRQRETGADLARLVADLVTLDRRLAAALGAGRPDQAPTEPLALASAGTRGRAAGRYLPDSPVVLGRPPLLADAFQDRPALRAAWDHQSAIPVRVIVGDGGTGKTQLAAAAFRAACRNVDIAIWVTAGTRAEVLSAYADARATIHGTDAAAGAGETHVLADRLLAWLASCSMRWLVVLDDVVDPADLIGLWPAGPTGQVVVTTRRRDAAMLVKGAVVEVSTFTAAESRAYLTATLRHLPGVPAGVLVEAAELADDLGNLPLALNHAVRAIVNDGITCADYRALLADRTRRLADVLPVDPVAVGDEYNRTVAGIWSLACERADRLAPVGMAGQILDLVAFLDPNGIPETVLTSEAVRRYLAEARRAGGVSTELARQAVRNLWRLSLVSHDPDDVCGVRIHSLAQRAAREQLAPEEARHVVQVAADAVADLWSAVQPGTALDQALRTNAALLATRHPAALWTPAVHPVLFQVGASLLGSGLVADAVNYFVELAATARQTVGPEHIATLAARHHLARARAEAGEVDWAVAAFGALLTDLARVLGTDHPDALSARAELGWWRGVGGDPDGAVAVLSSLSTDQGRLLGADHPETMRTRNSLARWRGMAGDLAGATTAFKHLLADELRVLGPDHPDTLTTRNNFAHVCGQAGDPGGAATAVQQVLAARLRVLGPDHPRTLATREHLAEWLGEAGDPQRAVAEFEAVLADEVRVLGPDHPRTLRARARMDRWLCAAGGDPPAGRVI